MHWAWRASFSALTAFYSTSGARSAIWSGFASFVGRGILIDLFEKFGSQRIESDERADDD